VLTLDVGERRERTIIQSNRVWPAAVHERWKVAGLDLRTIARDHRRFDHVQQLANVAWPIVRDEAFERLIAHPSFARQNDR